MPLYEYQCRSCGHTLEVIQRLSDPPLATCERCRGDLKKLISAPAFQFKGSGWYATDYADKGKGGKDTGEAKTKDSAKSDSKDSASDSSSKSSESSSSKTEKASADKS